MHAATARAQFSIEPGQHEFDPTQINTTSRPFEFTITNVSDSTVTLHPEHFSISAVEARSKELAVLSYNIEFDKRDWPGRLHYMLEGFRAEEIDILGLQEVIQRDTLDNQAMTIADALGFYYYFDSVDEEGRDQRYGNAIVSRYPILETNFRALEPTSAYRKVVHAKVNVEGNVVDVYNTHLHNPPDAGDIRTEQIADLLDFVEQTRSGGIMFLTGDFNSAPDWPEMEGLYGVFTDVYPLFHDNHLAPEHSTLNPRLGFPERRIDYVFFNDEGTGEIFPLSAALILDDVQKDDQLENDHFGVLARFDVSWDADEFEITSPDSAVVLGPGEAVNVKVVFKPMTTGRKEAELSVGDRSASVIGEAFDATIRHSP